MSGFCRLGIGTSSAGIFYCWGGIISSFVAAMPLSVAVILCVMIFCPGIGVVMVIFIC